MTEGNYGVVVTPSYVLLTPGAEETVTVIVELGYEDPVVIYQGNSYDDNNDIIIGDSFIATIKNSTSGGCQIEITAKNVNEIDSDILYVIATEIYNSDEINRSSTQLYGFPLIITVDPTLKKNSICILIPQVDIACGIKL